LLLIACGGSSSGTNLDDINNTASNPIKLRDLVFDVNEDGSLSGTITYDNSSQVQNAPTVAISIATQNGTIQITNDLAGSFNYAPDPDFSGQDTFEYTVTGPLGNTYTTTATINVLPVNDAPTLPAVSPVTIIGGTSQSLALPSIDVEGDAVAIQLVSAPSWVSTDGQVLQILPPVASVGSNETVTVKVSETGSSLESNSIDISLVIAPNTVGFENTTLSVSENSGSVSIPIVLANASLEALVVTVSVIGGSASNNDFTTPPTSVSFAPGQQSASLLIDLLDDSLYEQAETIELSIPSGQSIQISTANALVTINDDDPPPALTFNAISGLEGQQQTLTLTLANSIDFEVTGQLTSNADVTFSPQSFTIPAGQFFTDVLVTLVDDNIDEPDTTENFAISALTHASTAQDVQISITDNDAPSVVTISAVSPDIIEGNTGTIRFELDRASGFNLSIPFTVTGTVDASDYSITVASADLPAGQTQFDLPISILEDTLPEGLETLQINAATPTNSQLANNTVLLNIIDNEGVFGVSQFGTGIWLDTIEQGVWGTTTWR
jgi:hypothetical protein